MYLIWFWVSATPIYYRRVSTTLFIVESYLLCILSRSGNTKWSTFYTFSLLFFCVWCTIEYEFLVSWCMSVSILIIAVVIVVSWTFLLMFQFSKAFAINFISSLKKKHSPFLSNYFNRNIFLNSFVSDFSVLWRYTFGWKMIIWAKQIIVDLCKKMPIPD